jgi:ADP-heptose:LPS heptosyltransferase
MKFIWMRRIDFYVGFLPCHTLALLQKIRGRRKKPLSASEKLRKVLVVKFLGFGSILMTTPLMAELKKNSPQTKIHFLTFRDNKEICESINLIDRVLSLEKKSLTRFSLSLIKNLRFIREQNYDVVFNLEFFSNFSLFLAAVSRSKRVLCFGGRHEYRKTLCQDIISYENELHIIDKYCNFLKPLEIEPSQGTKPLTEVNESPESNKHIRDLLMNKDVDVTKDFLVVVNINAGEMSSIRKWPLEYYQQLISFMLQKKRVKVILIGGREDVSYVSRLEEMIAEEDKVVNLAGKIDLRDLISLMKASHLFLGNDSGPLHLAQACGLSNVGFFGPESPYVYGHPDEKNYSFYSNLPCSPCLNVYTNKDTRCKDNRCLRLIKPDQVIEVLEKMYFTTDGEK